MFCNWYPDMNVLFRVIFGFHEKDYI